MRIVVFVDDIHPREHLFGLLEIKRNSQRHIEMTLVSKDKSAIIDHQIAEINEVSNCNSPSILKVLKLIQNADLVIGMPGKYSLLRFFSRLRLLRFFPVYFGPGRVSKAVGFYKHPDVAGAQSLRIHLKFILFNTFYLANDDIDAVYTSAALGYPLSRILVAPIPKYFYMNKLLRDGKASGRPKGILIAPTHRWGSKIPELMQLLEPENFPDELKSPNCRIYHSKHPETPEVVLHQSIQPFEGEWCNIDVVVTDYSSIGDDFLNSGGRQVIYFIPDRTEFEKNQGVGLFFDDSVRRGIVCFDVNHLIREINEIRDELASDHVAELSFPFYFDDLLEACKLHK